MRDYEATCVFRPDLPEDKIDALISKLEKRIKASGGELGGVSKRGRRSLPFNFRRYKGGRDGLFVLINFKGEKNTPSEVESTLKISEDVIRYLVVRAEAPPPVEAKEEKVEVSPEVLLPAPEEKESGQS